jgi:hypothetical protein
LVLGDGRWGDASQQATATTRAFGPTAEVLSSARLTELYGISVHVGIHDGQRYVVAGGNDV